MTICYCALEHKIPVICLVVVVLSTSIKLGIDIAS